MARYEKREENSLGTKRHQTLLVSFHLPRKVDPLNKHHRKDSAGSEFQILSMVDGRDGCYLLFFPPLELMHNLKNATSNSHKEHIEVLTYGYA